MNSPYRGTLRRSRQAEHRRKTTPPALLLLVIFGLGIVGTVVLAACSETAASTGAAVVSAQRAIDRQRLDLDPTVPLDAELPQTSTILARDGSVLAEINDVRFGYRRFVPLSEISPFLPLATFAAEDRRFYEHQGVDPIGLIRALTQNANSDGVASGASTLEMQLVRNVFFADEKSEQTLSRKLKEAFAAYQLDRRYSKSQLLEGYLNVVYYGNMSYGAEAASERYFGKPAKELILPEAALLAGMPQSPSAYDPLRNLPAAKDRQGHVLGLMQKAGFISPEDYDWAMSYELKFASTDPVQTRAPHWVNFIQDAVREQFGPDALFTGGLKIQTTIDPEIQAMAERIVLDAEGVRQQARANNSAMVVMDPRNGQILAMVGSKNFFDRSIDGQVNVAVAGRQPGSSIKPLVYLSGYEKGLNPAVEVIDSITSFSAPPGQPPYVPTNFENKFYGRITLRDALGNSLNVPAVKVLKYVGVSYFKGMARRLGITSLDNWDDRWLSLTLGGGEVKLLELTGAYTTIAREGNYVKPEPFLSVENARGEVLHAAELDPAGEQVVDPRLAFQLLHGMGDPGTRLLTFGPTTPLNLPRPSMVKTGTTDDYRDTWTMGCLPQVCVGVWMGNTNNAPMLKVSSSLTAGKIWVDMMNGLVDRYKWAPDRWPVPDGVIITQVPNVGVSRPGQPTHEEVFLPGNEQRYLLEMDWRRPD